ncbi:dethiobiotin synthase [Neptunomonas antarctica]|uniref:ATP-dependent dethiobiotin synthetase BioD n=1 Tax=Neptunomonas antarctica TaxID=619304 RepID=A0A1N7JFP7_9GAMM|nr:dethiobiotin synthase [Neptunomonas antarctica]SIS48183.1 dethiobiotin synthetase [Neptunomonas antarctica]
MAKRQFFVTGTDTDVGKTIVTAGLLEKANQLGYRTIGLKPVAAGCLHTENGLQNSDALLLQQTASVALSYSEVNPIVFEAAVAPHIAAEQTGKRLSADRIAALCRGAMMNPADVVLIEGAGGWRVPFNRTETFADVPKLLNTPVILVVGIKLGCINHALLTAEAIVRDGLSIAGWVANRIDPDMSCSDDNVATLETLLQTRFRAPLLGDIPFLQALSPIIVAEYLDVQALFE